MDTPNPEPNRKATYARVSSANNPSTGSIEEQLHDVRAYAEQNEIEVVREIIDTPREQRPCSADDEGCP